MNDNSNIPKVFISYSWTTPEHQEWVLRFSEQLVKNGADVTLDKWILQLGHDVNYFMEQLGKADKVLMICDSNYKRKAESREGGVGIEAQIITAEIYDKAIQGKYVPIIRAINGNKKDCIPIFAAAKHYIDFSDDEKFDINLEYLLRDIFKRPRYVKPPLGKQPEFIFNAEKDIASQVISFDTHQNNKLSAQEESIMAQIIDSGEYECVLELESFYEVSDENDSQVEHRRIHIPQLSFKYSGRPLSVENRRLLQGNVNKLIAAGFLSTSDNIHFTITEYTHEYIRRLKATESIKQGKCTSQNETYSRQGANTQHHTTNQSTLINLDDYINLTQASKLTPEELCLGFTDLSNMIEVFLYKKTEKLQLIFSQFSSDGMYGYSIEEEDNCKFLQTIPQTFGMIELFSQKNAPHSVFLHRDMFFSGFKNVRDNDLCIRLYIRMTDYLYKVEVAIQFANHNNIAPILQGNSKKLPSKTEIDEWTTKIVSEICRAISSEIE